MSELRSKAEMQRNQHALQIVRYILQLPSIQESWLYTMPKYRAVIGHPIPALTVNMEEERFFVNSAIQAIGGIPATITESDDHISVDLMQWHGPKSDDAGLMHSWTARQDNQQGPLLANIIGLHDDLQTSLNHD